MPDDRATDAGAHDAKETLQLPNISRALLLQHGGGNAGASVAVR
jgi:hypothetical protein